MAKIILLCGKMCSGKSTYANKIKLKYNAVILSCDELMLELFEEQLGDKHRIVLQKVQNYLYQLAEQIVTSNTNVILDFGHVLSERKLNCIMPMKKLRRNCIMLGYRKRCGCVTFKNETKVYKRGRVKVIT